MSSWSHLLPAVMDSGEAGQVGENANIPSSCVSYFFFCHISNSQILSSIKRKLFGWPDIKLLLLYSSLSLSMP